MFFAGSSPVSDCLTATASYILQFSFIHLSCEHGYKIHIYIFTNTGLLLLLQGFELKRRGELKLIKVFQSEVRASLPGTCVNFAVLRANSTDQPSWCAVTADIETTNLLLPVCNLPGS